MTGQGSFLYLAFNGLTPYARGLNGEVHCAEAHGSQQHQLCSQRGARRQPESTFKNIKKKK